jgi:hypothetical protein
MGMESEKSGAPESGPSETLAWGPWIMAACGAGLLLLGACRFFVRHQFGYMDALYCGAALIPAALLLLIIDYTIHHAKFAALIPFLFSVLLVTGYPVFDVAFGLALMGAVAGPAMKERRDENRRRKAGMGGSENDGDIR